jgi:hypothetical protein
MSGGEEIRVDLTSLTDVAHEVRDVADGVTRPAAEQASRSFGWGAQFGGSAGWASDELAAARRRYTECMRASAEAAARSLRLVSGVATAAELVAEAYGQVDALAAGRQSHVVAAFEHAVGQLQHAEKEAAAAAARAQAAEEEFLRQHRDIPR